MVRQALDAVAEQLEPNLALDALRAGDRGERDRCARRGRPKPANYSAFVFGLASACGESSVGGATSSAPSAGASALAPLVGDSSAGASLASGSATPLPRRHRLRPRLLRTAARRAPRQPRLRDWRLLAGLGFGSRFFGDRLFGRKIGGVGRRLLRGDFFGLGGHLDRRSLLGDLFRDGFAFRGRLGGRFLDRIGDYRLGLFLLRLGNGLFRRRIGGFFRFGGLLRTLFDALLGLLARLGLLRVVARGTLTDAGGIEEAQDAVRRLRADRQPMRDALGVELHALGRILRQQRVVGAELLDEAAVARRAAVGDDDAVIRALLGAAAGQANCKSHLSISFQCVRLFL